MSLKQDILPYVDGNDLVSPTVVVPGTKRASDNGVLFTSEYFIELAYSKELTALDVNDWHNRMSKCMQEPGLLARAPGDKGQEGPDDYYGLLAASKVLRDPTLAQSILAYGKKHVGWFNNENPGSIFHKNSYSINWEALLWRQVGLYVATLSAAQALKWYHFPLVMLVAILIAFSNIREDPNQVSNRLLTWLLIKTLEDNKVIVFGAISWWKRQRKLYDTDPVKKMMEIYFGVSHPLARYF